MSGLYQQEAIQTINLKKYNIANKFLIRPCNQQQAQSPKLKKDTFFKH
jgi:hypothetical protein